MHARLHPDIGFLQLGIRFQSGFYAYALIFVLKNVQTLNDRWQKTFLGIPS